MKLVPYSRTFILHPPYFRLPCMPSLTVGPAASASSTLRAHGGYDARDIFVRPSMKSDIIVRRRRRDTGQHTGTIILFKRFKSRYLCMKRRARRRNRGWRDERHAGC